MTIGKPYWIIISLIGLFLAIGLPGNLTAQGNATGAQAADPEPGLQSQELNERENSPSQKATKPDFKRKFFRSGDGNSGISFFRLRSLPRRYLDQQTTALVSMGIGLLMVMLGVLLVFVGPSTGFPILGGIGTLGIILGTLMFFVGVLMLIAA